MKKLMVRRCEETYGVTKGLWAVVQGQSVGHYPDCDLIAQTVRCEQPLGHRERGHIGSVNDEGRRVFSWAGWDYAVAA